ncbi:MAG: transcription initiation factor IIB family protein [Candidatus Helarchaeales archaeon]
MFRKKSRQIQHLDLECNHEPVLDEVRGEYTCSKCGLVLSTLYMTPSYQLNESDFNVSNSSKNYVALGDRVNVVDGLGSFIDYQHSTFFLDKKGMPLSAQHQILFKRLKYRYDLRARINNRETHYRALKTLNKIVSQLKLSDKIRDRAAYFYQKIIKNEEKKEITNHLSLIALCLLLAAREYEEKAPVTIQEITNSFRKLGHRVSERSLIQLGLKLRPKYNSLFKHQSRISEHYLPRVISQVINHPAIRQRLLYYNYMIQDYEEALRKISNKILSEMPKEKRGGRNPHIFAVAVLYCADQIIAKKEKKHAILTQKLLSKATKTAEYSIRDHWRAVLHEYFKKLKENGTLESF